MSRIFSIPAFFLALLTLGTAANAAVESVASMEALKSVLVEKQVSFSMGEGSQNDTSYPMMVLRFASSAQFDDFIRKTADRIEIFRNSKDSGSPLEIVVHGSQEARFLASNFTIENSILLMISPSDALLKATVSIINQAETKPNDGVQTIYKSSFKFDSVVVSTFVGQTNLSPSDAAERIYSDLTKEGLKIATLPGLRIGMNIEQTQSNPMQSYWVGSNKIANVTIEAIKQGTKVTIHETFQKDAK